MSATDWCLPVPDPTVRFHVHDCNGHRASPGFIDLPFAFRQAAAEDANHPSQAPHIVVKSTTTVTREVVELPGEDS